MKKTVIIMAAVAVAASFCGCNKQKEGEYAPKQKLVEVYQEYFDNEEGTWESDGKELTESYVWNGDVLQSVTYPDGDESVVETFEYDNQNRIIGSTFTIPSESGVIAKTQYVYNDDELTEMDILSDGEQVMSFKFTHTDGKITKMQILEYIDYDLDKKASFAKVMQYANPLRRMMPQQVVKDMDRVMAKAASKDYYGYDLVFTWDGDNVATMVADMMDTKITVSYQYDNKLNPYYGFLEMYSIEYNMMENALPLFSKNNPTKIAISATGEYSDSYQVSYTYQYDGKYPASSTMELSYTIQDYVYNEATGGYDLVNRTYQERIATTYIYAK